MLDYTTAKILKKKEILNKSQRISKTVKKRLGYDNYFVFLSFNKTT